MGSICFQDDSSPFNFTLDIYIRTSIYQLSNLTAIFLSAGCQELMAQMDVTSQKKVKNAQVRGAEISEAGGWMRCKVAQYKGVFHLSSTGTWKMWIPMCV